MSGGRLCRRLWGYAAGFVWRRALATTSVSIDEYLQTSYSPDAEYVDGELREKPVVGFRHGVVQGLLFTWFRMHRREWGVQVSMEARTQVQTERVRLPDVVVVREEERVIGTLQRAPLIAIEVLSETDSYTELKQRAMDLRAMGTENVWLIDPERKAAEVWNGVNWQVLEGSRLEAVGLPVFVNLDWLWVEMES